MKLKIYRRCFVLIKKMAGENCPFDIISYSVAYEFGLGFRTADKLTKFVMEGL
jgi:hypothetical protein